MGIIHMSLSAAILILAIIVIRWLAIHRLPKKTFVVFWCIVLARLLIPFSITLPMPLYFYTGMVVGDMKTVTDWNMGLNAEVIACNAAGYSAKAATAGTYTGAASDSTMDSLMRAELMPDMDFPFDILPDTGVLAVINVFNAILPTLADDVPMSSYITVIWIIGVAVTALFFIVTHFRTRRVYR